LKARVGSDPVLPSEVPEARLGLLRGFELKLDGEAVELPLSAQRLVAFLALHDRPLHRAHVAGVLWTESTDAQSKGSLRSALWRLGEPARALVQATGQHLSLGSEVRVDARRSVELARRLQRREEDPGAWDDEAIDEMIASGDLLPDWYEDWVVFERERLRQVRLHALEQLCLRLALAGRFDRAIQAGLAAVRGEPLRESAHRALVAAHLAEGNGVEALRQYEAYRRLVRAELGIEPSPAMESLVGSLRQP
jgi:DNA-binding SARP family transcriptional activator